MQHTRYYIFLVVMVIFLWSGCSGGDRPADFPRLYPVKLIIQLDGQPLTDALVMLHTDDVKISKWSVGSYTDSEGNAVLVTHGQFQGAPAGRFKVCVSKQGAPPEIQEQIDANRNSMAPSSLATSMGMTIPKQVEYVDSLFRSPESTPLEIEISPKGRKMATFTLEVHKPNVVGK